MASLNTLKAWLQCANKDNDCFDLNFLKLMEEDISVINALCLDSSHDMSRLMTKPTKWLFAQRRLRSAWASASESSLSA